MRTRESHRLLWQSIIRSLPAALVASVSLLAFSAQADVLVNNNDGASTTANFTQSSAAVLGFGPTVIVGFADSGSLAGNTNHFTGYARSTDGGLTFTDLGTLPNSTFGDAAFQKLARDASSGAVYMTTLPLSNGQGMQLFRSTDGGITFGAPVTATPGVTNPDTNALAVDNFSGTGNGTVYVAVRDFQSGHEGIFLYKSTNGGMTFGSGVLIANGSITNVGGPTIAIQPDHSVTVAWLQAGATIVTRRSTDGGLTFAAPTTVATLNTIGINDAFGLTGVRQGTAVASGFRSNAFPQMVANPVSGHLYAVFTDNPAGVDKVDVFLVQSTDSGATWSPRVRVNSDATLTDQWQPTIAITPDGKHLGIFWYDRRTDLVGNNLIAYFGRTCDISGGTLICGADFQISDVNFLPEFGRDNIVNPAFMGDFDFASADDDFFYVAWGDNRLNLAGGNGRNDPNVFFDRIAIDQLVAVAEPSGLALFAVALIPVALRYRRRHG